MLMHEYVEEVFDNGCFVLIPVHGSGNPILRWRILIAVAHTELAPGSRKNLDGSEVSFKNYNRPAARFLY